MSEREPWLGFCHLYKDNGEVQENYVAIAAGFCGDREVYDVAVAQLVTSKGYRLMWSEEVLPAGQWLTRHPKEREGAGLARAVHAAHLVEIGTLIAAGKKGEETSDAQDFLIIEEIEDVEPLEAQFGVHPKLTTPVALQEPMFGQPEPTEAEIELYGEAKAVPPLNTYAILDAAKMDNFVLLLEGSDLKYRCLFKGGAEKELRNVAPYVVELKEENSFTRALFTSSGMPADMWEKELGIYIRSRGSLEDMWKHFRKFTRVQDEDGKWFYHRFWEPEYFLYFFTFMKNTTAIRRLKDIPMFIFQIAGSAVSISPEYDRLSLLYTEHDEQVDLMFDASTAMVAFRHIRELEETYKGKIDAEETFGIFQNLFSGREMDYKYMQDGLDIVYSVIYCYRDLWPKYLTQDILDRCFEEDGTTDHFLTLLQGQCIFAMKNGRKPHELCFTGGIKQWQDQLRQS